MDLGLKRKVAIVAASSKGIGKAVAAGLAAEGARVTMLARNEAELRQSAEEIGKQYQADILAVPADVTRYEDIRRVVQRTLERWGAVNILVANAGGPPLGDFAEQDDARWEEAFQLTLMSVVRLVREVRPHMQRAGGGAVVTVQSTSVKSPLDHMILSNSLRSGVIGLAKSLSLELAQDGIRVNNVLPGAILTDRLRHHLGERAQRLGKTFEEVRGMREAQIPLGHLGAPEDVANMIVFLASDRAQYVTGVTVQVDGGFVRSVL
jgi:3-oxoacyl-[acyl-carrier protein] reductase